MAVTARAGGGTGARSGEIRAGGAFVELFAKSGKLSEDLNKATAEVGKFGANAGKLAGAQIATAIGGPIGLAIAAVGVALKGIMDEVVFPHEFARQAERQGTLSAKVLELHEKRIEGVRDALKDLSATAGTADGQQKIAAMAQDAERELRGLETSLKSVQKEYDKFTTLTTDAGTASLYLTAPFSGGLAGQRDGLREVLDERQKAFDSQLKLVTEIRKQLTEVSDPTRSREAVKALEGYTKELRDQFDVLVGINKETAEQAKLRKLAEQYGWAPGSPMYDAAAKAVKDTNVAQATKSIREFAEALDDERARIEDPYRDERRVELDRLAEQFGDAVDPAELKRARDAIRDVNAAEAVEAAQAWGESFRDIAPWAIGQPQAVWGSFSGSGSMVNPAKAFQDEQLKLGEEGNKLLAAIDRKIGDMDPWIL